MVLTKPPRDDGDPLVTLSRHCRERGIPVSEFGLVRYEAVPEKDEG